jgi:hypothetical protein
LIRASLAALVIPTRVGVQLRAGAKRSWIPAFAGMTMIDHRVKLGDDVSLFLIVIPAVEWQHGGAKCPDRFDLKHAIKRHPWTNGSMIFLSSII